MREHIANLARGENWNEVKGRIIETMSPWLNPEAAKKRAVLLMRHHAFSTYAAAQTASLDAAADIFEYKQYLSSADFRVRPSHAALHGIILPANDPFWEEHTPPWEWNCRCEVVGCLREEMEEEKALDAKRPPEGQRVLSAFIRSRMHSEKRLNRGLMRNVDLRTPKEKGGNYSINIRQLNMPIKELKQRWEPEEQALFSKWAQSVRLDDGRSLLDWSEGKSAPVVVRNKSGKRPERDSPTKLFSRLGIRAKKDMTLAHVAALRSELQVSKPLLASAKVRGYSGPWSASMREETVKETIQEFFSYLSPQVVKRLPMFWVKLENKLPFHMMGSYNPYTRILSLNSRYWRQHKSIRETIFHELTHWVHLHAPKTKQKALQRYFKRRIAGEKVVALKGFSGSVHGYEDDFGKDNYAGALYPMDADDPVGYELPTVHLEKLAWSDAELLERLNNKGASRTYAFRNAFKKSLSLYYAH